MDTKAPRDGTATRCFGWKEGGEVSTLLAEYPRELVKSFKWLYRRGDKCVCFYLYPLKYKNKTSPL